MIGERAAVMPSRSSTISQSFFKNRPTMLAFRTRRLHLPASLHRDGLGADLHLVPLNSNDVLRKRMRRGAGGHRAVFVVDPAVTRAHEKSGVGKPAHRTTEVGAIYGECHELLFVHP